MTEITKFLALSIAVFALSACSIFGGLPEGEEFQYNVGEVVYYKSDYMPMLIEKQVYKKKTKKYEVVFKNEKGELLHNTVLEDELISTPPSNKARI